MTGLAVVFGIIAAVEPVTMQPFMRASFDAFVEAADDLNEPIALFGVDSQHPATATRRVHAVLRTLQNALFTATALR